jgi:hypothetical protein
MILFYHQLQISLSQIMVVVLIYFGYTVTGPYILNEKTVYPFKKIARNYEQVVSRTLHVDGGCSVGLWFSNMKNKKHCHMILHLVHNPTL